VQLIGLVLLGFIVWFGFGERTQTVISAFDLHALVMVLGGSTAAILVSSSALTSLRTLACLREIVPAAGTLGPGTDSLERERVQLVELWRDGRRAHAAQLAEASRHPSVRRMLDLVLSRAPDQAVQATFLELRHAELSRWQPAISNWELLAKLGPSFGMVGTITGMIQLFRTLDESTQMGAALSLALLATLYGVAFGAGVAGPIGHFLRGLLDERIGVLERCEKSVAEMVARGGRAALEG
jgi:chemotaxis protein MotA